ncbi:hypothetical protein [Wolbachia endosymbiont (group A) of Sicus ferrugineus]|uniref:hypothetical protein n=1 Tax=Wolbachia endosymbiont (group A) of Sicus ferrugineus TaxID=2954056 RepID=UPI002230139F|nr:hypothetical protein [Wolbachia endosymbiont (group A) of Sicus ferrugineus]
MDGLQKARGYLLINQDSKEEIIGALNEGKVKAPWVIEGYCKSEIFEAYVENVLVPVLRTDNNS